MQSVNAGGVSRMSQALAGLQPALSSLGAKNRDVHPDTSHVFDHARAYYTLLTTSTDGLLRAAAERPTRFTPAEYMALLHVRTFRRTQNRGGPWGHLVNC